MRALRIFAALISPFLVLSRVGSSSLPSSLLSEDLHHLRFLNEGTCPATLPLEIFADDGISGDHFGFSIAMSGNTIVVGAVKDDHSSGTKLDSGSAYVFLFDGSTSFVQQQQKLVASDTDEDDWFGSSVAIDEDIIVVGAHKDGDNLINSGSNGVNSGSAYVFRRTKSGRWVQQQKLTANDGEADDWFGESVAVSGTTVVVGAGMDNTPSGFDAGSAYVFDLDDGSTSSWTQMQKLTAIDGSMHDNFGKSVAIEGDVLVIGAPAKFRAPTNGAVYIFAKKGGSSSWTLQQKITASDGVAGDQFGKSIATRKDTLVVGAPGSAEAYIFRHVTGVWNEEKILIMPDGPTDFGQSVATAPSGDVVAVGIGFDTEKGGSYIFEHDGSKWSDPKNLMDMKGEKNIYFGFSVALTDRFLAVGAFGQLNNKGSTYMFCAPGAKVAEKGGTSIEEDGTGKMPSDEDTSGTTVWVGDIGVRLLLLFLATTLLLMS